MAELFDLLNAGAVAMNGKSKEIEMRLKQILKDKQI